MRIFYLTLLAFCFIFSLGQTSKAASKKCLHIRVIVPSSVGTATDLIIRAYAETINRQQSGPLLKVLNKTQNAVIEKNMSGRPDGCQILAVTQSLVSNFLNDKTSIEWSKFTPIAMLSRTPMAVVARGSLRDANLANIIEVALQNPNVVSLGETSNPLEQMFRMSLEVIAVLMKDEFGMSLESFRNPSQIGLGSCWHQAGLILGLLLDHSGNIFGIM